MPEPGKPETLSLHLANERTMLAWVRTGIALMAFGFAIARFGLFLRQVAGIGVSHVPAANAMGSGFVGVVLVALGAAASVTATLRFASVRRAIERGVVGAPGAGLVYALGAVAAAMGVVMAALLVRSLGD